MLYIFMWIYLFLKVKSLTPPTHEINVELHKRADCNNII